MLMKFYIYVFYKETVRQSRVCCNILTNNKDRTIVSMTDIRYIGPIRLILTYLQLAVISCIYAKRVSKLQFVVVNLVAIS